MRRALVLAVCLGVAADARAQRVIYDATRDQTAQQAAAAARDVTTGTLFETMLRNVDAQSRLEADTVTAFAKEQMRAKLNAFRVWSESERGSPEARHVLPGERARLPIVYRLCPADAPAAARGRARGAGPDLRSGGGAYKGDRSHARPPACRAAEAEGRRAARRSAHRPRICRAGGSGRRAPGPGEEDCRSGRKRRCRRRYPLSTRSGRAWTRSS